MAAVAAAIEGRTVPQAPNADEAQPDATGSPTTPPVSPNVPANSSLLDAVQSGFPSGWAVPSKGKGGEAQAQAAEQDAPVDRSTETKKDAATDVNAVAAIIAATAPAVTPAQLPVPTGATGDTSKNDATEAHGNAAGTPDVGSIDAAAKAAAATTASDAARAVPAQTDDASLTGHATTESTPGADDTASAPAARAQTPKAASARAAVRADANASASQTSSRTPSRFADFVARAISSRPNATIADVIAAAANHADNAAGASDAGDGIAASGSIGPAVQQRALVEDLRARAAQAMNLASATGDRTPAATRASAPAAGLDALSLRALGAADKNTTPATDTARGAASVVADVVQKAGAPAHDAGVSFGFENSFAGGQKGATVLAPVATTSFATSLSTASEATLPPDTANQIVQAIRLQWANGGAGEARITLQPEQFGDVTVSVRVDRGQVVARVEADAPVVREWLQSNQATLRHGLAEQNLALDRLEVSEPRESRDTERRGQRDAPDQQQPQRRPRRAPLDDAFEVVA